MTSNFPHEPIMVEEMLSIFEGSHLRNFVDGTIGAGGHAEAILKAHPEIETFIGLDQDPSALLIAKERLAPFGSKVQLIHSNFSEFQVGSLGKIDGFFLTWEFLPCN